GHSAVHRAVKRVSRHFFFFQAEDGIRDFHVTGVQTCALPISKNNALYGGDSIQGSVYLGLDGTPRLCPTYLHVDDYLNTIRFVEHLSISTFVGCHWSVKRGDEIRDFCAESRAFIQRADQLILDLVKTPHTLREICLTLAPALGDWEHVPALDLELVYALSGHVDRLVERGKIVSRRNAEGKLEYALP